MIKDNIEAVWFVINTLYDWLIVQNCPKSVLHWKILHFNFVTFNLMEKCLKDSSYRFDFYAILITTRYEVNNCFLWLFLPVFIYINTYISPIYIYIWYSREKKKNINFNIFCPKASSVSVKLNFLTCYISLLYISLHL